MYMLVWGLLICQKKLVKLLIWNLKLDKIVSFKVNRNIVLSDKTNSINKNELG